VSLDCDDPLRLAEFWLELLGGSVLWRSASSIGATVTDVQPDPRWRVLLDPAEHPFCIITLTPPPSSSGTKSSGERILTLPELTRPPVTLRPFTPGDIDVVLEAATDPAISMITTVPAYPDQASARAYLDRQRARAATGHGYSLAVADSLTGQAVGQIGVWPLQEGGASVGYWIVPSARRRGYATRALALISKWGLQLPDVVRLELYIEPHDEASWRTAEHVGYQREGLLRSWRPVGGHRRDMYMYALTDSAINVS
jgi:RimJ/RimL family protein N-acetyltransferase